MFGIKLLLWAVVSVILAVASTECPFVEAKPLSVYGTAGIGSFVLALLLFSGDVFAYFNSVPNRDGIDDARPLGTRRKPPFI